MDAVNSLVSLLVKLNLLEKPPEPNIYQNKAELPLRLLSKLNKFDELSAIKKVAEHLDLPVIDLVAPFVKENLEAQSFKEKLDVQLCWSKKIVPLWREEDGRIGIAMANPFDLDSLNTLCFLLNGKAKQYMPLVIEISGFSTTH